MNWSFSGEDTISPGIISVVCESKLFFYLSVCLLIYLSIGEQLEIGDFYLHLTLSNVKKVNYILCSNRMGLICFNLGKLYN